MTNTDIQIKRHYRKLSSKETDELVKGVAGLIVRFLKVHPKPEEREAKKEPKT
jgi:hypothetical protein